MQGNLCETLELRSDGSIEHAVERVVLPAAGVEHRIALTGAIAEGRRRGLERDRKIDCDGLKGLRFTQIFKQVKQQQPRLMRRRLRHFARLERCLERAARVG